MKTKRMRRISALIILAMMITGTPVYAMELQDTEDVLFEADDALNDTAAFEDAILESSDDIIL